MNPDEIEDITILKDAASTSLYGSRAANGVVLITTKRGKPGQTSVSFNAYAGIQKVPKKGRIEMLTAEEFAQFKKESFEDENRTVPKEFEDPSKYRGKNNDWYDALLHGAHSELQPDGQLKQGKHEDFPCCGCFQPERRCFEQQLQTLLAAHEHRVRYIDKGKNGLQCSSSVCVRQHAQDGWRPGNKLFSSMHCIPGR